MNQVLLDLGFMEIRWYSVLILIAVIVGAFIAKMESKRFNVANDFFFNLAFWVIIAGFLGARLYYVAFNWSYYSKNLLEIVQIWHGGMAIHGGLLGGFLALLIYTKKYKVDTFKITDIIVPSLVLGQAIGRWGNFFNGEAHGAATTLEHLQSLHLPEFIIEGMKIDGVYYTPTFLYESLWCLIGFIVLIIVRRNKYIKVGQLTCLYLMWYSLGRFFIEAMRTDSLMLGSLKAAQVVSIVLFVVAFIVFVIKSRKGKFDNLYNEIGSEGNIKF